MPQLDIRIDLRNGEPLFEKEKVIESDIISLGRMPHGMKSGNSSVAAIIQFREPLYTKDGREVTHGWCETSMALYLQATTLFRAAEQVAKTTGGN